MATKTKKQTTGPVLEALKAKRAEYTVTKGDDGRRLIDSGDDVATQLRGMDLDDVYSTVAKALGVTEKELRERYAGLNPGMQRMNLGNRLRGHQNGGEKKATKKAPAKKATKTAKTKKASKKAPVEAQAPATE